MAMPTLAAPVNSSGPVWSSSSQPGTVARRTLTSCSARQTSSGDANKPCSPLTIIRDSAPTLSGKAAAGGVAPTGRGVARLGEGGLRCQHARTLLGGTASVGHGTGVRPLLVDDAAIEHADYAVGAGGAGRPRG